MKHPPFQLFKTLGQGESGGHNYDVECLFEMVWGRGIGRMVCVCVCVCGGGVLVEWFVSGWYW